MNERLLKNITLTTIPGFGPVSQNRLLYLCDTVDRCYKMSREELDGCDRKKGRFRIGEKRLELFIKAREDAEHLDQAERILQKCVDEGISVITREDEEYPDRMLSLADMPLVLYVRGNLKINEYRRSVGIVGARRCSPEGKDSAISTAEEEVSKGAAIISGMAKGIDSYAHTACLKAGGYTIAVLGGGPDQCYPEEHRPLYERIIRQGCVLSEYPPGTPPRKYMFPARNRLIAALSNTLYVIDAGRRSGTESTTAACQRYGIDFIKI